jgi:transposase
LEEITMTTRHGHGELVRQAEVLTVQEEAALVGFLAGFSGLTREAYQLDLRQYVEWCAERPTPLFRARRSDIEGFGRSLEALGRARATIPRRLCTIACFYRYAEQEDFIAKSPATHVRRPRLDYESHATGLDRNEVGAMLVAAGENTSRIHNERSFARLCGAAPLDASNGKQQRHRLSRGGDRQANSALWRIVITRLSYDPATRRYLERRCAEGRTKTEAIRCLKRYVARELYACLPREDWLDST